MEADGLTTFGSSPYVSSTQRDSDVARTGIAGNLVSELLVWVIEYAAYIPEDDKRFWLHTYESERMMLSNDHLNHLQQYAAVNRWWRRVIHGAYPVDIQCQTTLQMERAVDALINLDASRIRVRTLIWDHEVGRFSRASNVPPPTGHEDLPPAATQTRVLKRFLKQVDGGMVKALVLNFVMLEPVFDVTAYRGWDNVTYFCYGTDETPECFHTLTALLREFRNLRSLLLMGLRGSPNASVFPPRPTYSLKTFQMRWVDDLELVGWASGNSRTTVEELGWLPWHDEGSANYEKDLSGVFPGRSQLSLRRLWVYAQDFRVIGHLNFDLLTWIQLSLVEDEEIDDFELTTGLLEVLTKCKALERLWIDFHGNPLFEAMIAPLLGGVWPALVFLRVTIEDDTEDGTEFEGARMTEDGTRAGDDTVAEDDTEDDTEFEGGKMTEDDKMAENVTLTPNQRIVVDLRRICRGRNIVFEINLFRAV